MQLKDIKVFNRARQQGKGRTLSVRRVMIRSEQSCFTTNRHGTICHQRHCRKKVKLCSIVFSNFSLYYCILSHPVCWCSLILQYADICSVNLTVLDTYLHIPACDVSVFLFHSVILINPNISIKPIKSVVHSALCCKRVIDRADNEVWGLPQEPTSARTTTEDASSCVSSVATASAPAPALTECWRRTGAVAVTTTATCSTLSGPS